MNILTTKYPTRVNPPIISVSDGRNLKIRKLIMSNKLLRTLTVLSTKPPSLVHLSRANFWVAMA
ncbi:MAG TPA: hypothetical protein PLY23_05335 [Alphaproteobacteria bacterium]|nr:hypothetical protein [Alphaproteobacteria bacterium]HQS94149.1 hypothetical protein [Alphaproteobacteria bacterium]